MSRPRKVDPVKLVSSVFSADRDLIGEIMKRLAQLFGRIDFISELIPFEFTRYYEEEMGRNQKRRFISFEDPVPPDILPEVKISTNEIETAFSKGGRRKINIDPGYISQGNLVLATGKPYAHRPYLGKGIYADLTLVYRRGSFRPLDWTYPDYREPEMLHMLSGIRSKYLIQLAQLKKDTPEAV